MKARTLRVAEKKDKGDDRDERDSENTHIITCVLDFASSREIGID
jgi:hypothetical protein